MKYQLGVRIDTTVGLLKWPDVFYSVRERKASDLISRAAQGSYTAICKLNKRSLTTFTSLAQKLTNQLFLEFRNSSVHEERQHSLSKIVQEKRQDPLS